MIMEWIYRSCCWNSS